MTTILTEKKDMALKIAKAVGAETEQNGFYEGNGFFVTWAAGHLLEQLVPEAEGEWSLQKLPILPQHFQLIPRQEKNANGKKTNSANAEKRLFVIRHLLARSQAIINAGDPGIEGELIQREILQYTNCRLPVWRLWYSSTNVNALRQAMNELRPSSEYDSLYQAAKSRSEADWLVGINGTIALTLSSDSRHTLSLGRVQTPVLAMVCKRFIDRETFKPEPFWKNILNLETVDGETFSVVSERFYNEQTALEELQKAKDQPYIKLTEYEQKTETEHPPLLYDLTELDKAAIRRHGLTAEEAETSAQSLYMAGYISYPRTPSQYITEHEFREIPSLIEGLRQYAPLANKAAMLAGRKLNNYPVNELKVTDHFGLIITEKIPEQLQDNNKIIYELIAERMLEAFSPDCIKEKRKAVVTIGDTDYKASASVILQPGWRNIRGVAQNDKESREIKKDENAETDEFLQLSIPKMRQNDTLYLTATEIRDGITTPPNLYTEDTLMTAMKNAGAKPDQQAQQKGLQKGLGTPATRGAIIKTLLQREYIHKTGKKNSIEPTVLGMTVYKIIRDKAIADADMTAQWEEALENIINKRIKHSDFDASIRQYAAQLTEELIMGEHKGEVMKAFSKEIIKCPYCGKPNYTSPKGYFCKKCDFMIWRNIAGKKLSDTQLRQLIETGITPQISGFKKKDGTTFSAALQRDGKRVFFAKK